MSTDMRLSRSIRTVAALIAAFFLVRWSPGMASQGEPSVVLPCLAVLLAILDAHGRKGVRVATPVEFAVLLFNGVFVAFAVHGMVLLVTAFVTRRIPRLECLLDDLTRMVLAVAAVLGLQSQFLGTTGVILSAAIYVWLCEGRVAAAQGQLFGDQKLRAMLVAAEVSCAVLLVVLYPRLLLWGALLVVVVLLVMKYSADLLMRVREAYQAMLEATVAAIEAGDVASVGHGVRVSKVAAKIGRAMGYRGTRLDTLSRAALLHELAVSQAHQLCEATELERAKYLVDVVPVLRALQGSRGEAPSQIVEMAYIVHRSALLDASATGRDVKCAAIDCASFTLTDSTIVCRVDSAVQSMIRRER